MHNLKQIDYLLVVLSLVGYFFLGYEIPRFDTLPLLCSVGVLFLIYLLILKRCDDQLLLFWIGISFAFRLSLLFSLPQLSDDFYRYIWDGRLLASGHQPFATLPSVYLSFNIPGVDQELYDHLNSKTYYAVYPPIAQYIFWVAVKISPKSILGAVIVIRVMIYLAEAGSVLLFSNLLKKFSLPRKNILIYALNPLIVLELSGNLHFEAFVIFFLLLAIYFITRQKYFLTAVSMGMSVCTKLVPLIFLPAFIGRMKVKELLVFFFIVLMISTLIFIPFFDWEVVNSLQSVSLYFNKFEFNASIYYIVREFGYIVYGYNIIQSVGWKLAILVFILIIAFIWIRNYLSSSRKIDRNDQSIIMEWMWMLLIYFIFTTTLHPWYISTLLALSVFTSFRFVVVWTGMIFLTYSGYTLHSFQESLWLTAMEYCTVAGYLGYELWTKRSQLHFLRKNRNLLIP